MKRNKDWVKKLLTFLEEETEGTGLLRHELQTLLERDDLGRRLTQEQVCNGVDYHLHLMVTAGLLEHYEAEDDYEEPEQEGDEDLFIEAHADNDEFIMTWEGHDYLEGKSSR